MNIPKIFDAKQFEFEHTDTLAGCAARAQEIFESWLKSQKRVYSQPEIDTTWNYQKMGTDTHEAFLVCISEIEKKCIEHIPKVESKQVIPSGSPEAMLMLGCRIVCAECGIELEPTGWRVRSEK